MTGAMDSSASAFWACNPESDANETMYFLYLFFPNEGSRSHIRRIITPDARNAIGKSAESGLQGFGNPVHDRNDNAVASLLVQVT